MPHGCVNQSFADAPGLDRRSRGGAGATGGTVIHARGCGLAGAEKFFGVTIQPEKDMIMILADRTVSCNIMSAIAEKAGPHTDSHAISFSLPASHVHGIGLDIPADALKKK
mgnify:CR=1 FL=1